MSWIHVKLSYLEACHVFSSHLSYGFSQNACQISFFRGLPCKSPQHMPENRANVGAAERIIHGNYWAILNLTCKMKKPACLPRPVIHGNSQWLRFCHASVLHLSCFFHPAGLLNHIRSMSYSSFHNSDRHQHVVQYQHFVRYLHSWPPADALPLVR